MKIYTGTCGGEKLEKLKEYNLGIMISSSEGREPSRSFAEFPCALDNGAFRCFERGYPFMEGTFWRTLDKCFAIGIDLDFIVTPDIVCGGAKSLEFSLSWTDKLIGCPNLALAVQDGMTSDKLKQYDLSAFSHIFVGGSVEWKWHTVTYWREFSRSLGKKLHIGQVGTLERFTFARDIAADSVDGTSLVRNENWHILDEFQNAKKLF